MYRLEVCELVVIRVHTDTEEKPGISSINNFIITKLEEICKRLYDALGNMNSPPQSSIGVFGPEGQLDGGPLLSIAPINAYPIKNVPRREKASRPSRHPPKVRTILTAAFSLVDSAGNS